MVDSVSVGEGLESEEKLGVVVGTEDLMVRETEWKGKTLIPKRGVGVSAAASFGGRQRGVELEFVQAVLKKKK